MAQQWTSSTPSPALPPTPSPTVRLSTCTLGDLVQIRAALEEGFADLWVSPPTFVTHPEWRSGRVSASTYITSGGKVHIGFSLGHLHANEVPDEFVYQVELQNGDVSSPLQICRSAVSSFYPFYIEVKIPGQSFRLRFLHKREVGKN